MNRLSPLRSSLKLAIGGALLFPLFGFAQETPTPVPPATRADAAEEIVRARYGETFDFPATPFFKDVPAAHPRFRSIQKFRADKITMGLGGDATVFGPDVPLPRYALASFLVRAKYGESFAFPEKPLFDDVPRTHANFKYVQKIAALGILSACRPGSFCPEDTFSPKDCRAIVKKFFSPSAKAPAARPAHP